MIDAQETALGEAMIDLGVALMENDLESAKTLVAFLNANYDPDANPDTIFILNNCLPLYDLQINDTLWYVLDNLQNYTEIEDRKFMYKVIDFEQRRDNDHIDTEIKTFVKNELLKTSLTVIQYNQLIRLAYMIHDYELLREIRQALPNVEG